MLKIKDDIDLSILEKLGFEFFRNWIGEFYWLEESMGNYIEIRVDTRNLRLNIFNDGKIMNILFDLIQAGLVERV